MVEELFEQVLASTDHGLNPEDFHVRQLGARVNSDAKANDSAYRADTEILCLDALGSQPKLELQPQAEDGRSGEGV